MWLLRQSPSIRWYLPEWQAAIDSMNWWYSTLPIALSTVLIGTFLHSYNYSQWRIKWIFWHFGLFTRIYWLRKHCFKSLDCQRRTLHKNRYSLIVPARLYITAHLLFTSNGFNSIFVSHRNENNFFYFVFFRRFCKSRHKWRRRKKLSVQKCWWCRIIVDLTGFTWHHS